jgi:hypothetical protein
VTKRRDYPRELTQSNPESHARDSFEIITQGTTLTVDPSLDANYLTSQKLTGLDLEEMTLRMLVSSPVFSLNSLS